jgi:hypothetical protein
MSLYDILRDLAGRAGFGDEAQRADLIAAIDALDPATVSPVAPAEAAPVATPSA